MKVLLVTSSYKNSWPFLPELRNALLKEGIIVHILDVTNLKLIDETGKQASNRFLSKFNTVRGGHRFIRFTAKKFIRKNLKTYDAINIHNLEYIYLYLIDELRKYSNNISVSIWGSDFYRATDKRIKSYFPLFDKLDFIGFGNVYTKADFDKKIPGLQTKHRIASFGIDKFEKLTKLLPEKENIKKQLDIPLEKITIVCGYNAYEAQQHLVLLEQLNELNARIKDKIFLLLPLTYGGTQEYKSKVIDKVEKIEIQYQLFTGFATDDEIARIRVIGDVVLNAQISDSFSASLQEHVLCNSILIAGEWLPYKVMADLGLKYFPVSKNNFGKKLEEVILDYDSFTEEVKSNNSILYKEGIWKNRVRGWIELYKAKK